MTVHKLFAAQALLPDGWAENVLFELDSGGSLARVTTNAEPAGAAQAKGPVLPGMPNLHSHALQRAMAGLAEHASPGGKRGDPFRTWREVMYRFISEKRRVGEEGVRPCSSGWSPFHSKKKPTRETQKT